MIEIHCKKRGIVTSKECQAHFDTLKARTITHYQTRCQCVNENAVKVRKGKDAGK